VNVQELLDYLRTNILNDRSNRTEESDDDYLWTDETLVTNINEAHRRFARRSFIIRDSTTTEVVDVTLEEGVNEYTLHPAILHVITAKVEDATMDLLRLGHVSLGLFVNPNIIAYSPAYESLSPGAPIAYTTDETLGEDDDGTISAVTMRVFPTPRAEDEGTIIKLRVVRMPLDDLTTTNLSAIPEVPRDHHLEMLDWAAHLSLRIADQDAGNQKLADKYAGSFEAHVQEAKKLVLRKLYAPRPWGLGRGGFSWPS
jgi:hypothetical protein